MKIAILGSGSSGNSIFIESNNYKILIDAGFSGKKLKDKLENIDVDISTINALLITHEHSDHILGAGIICRKYNIPIYITKESYEFSKEKLGKIENSLLNFISNNHFNLFNTFNIYPFDVMHDATRTLGYRIEVENKKVGIITDIGYVDNYSKKFLKDLNLLIVEANYDYDMLMQNDYPWQLKSRVKSNNGHLSNEDAAKLICDVYHENIEKVYFVHMSKDSNTYDLAYNTISSKFKENNINIDFKIIGYGENSKIYYIKGENNG